MSFLLPDTGLSYLADHQNNAVWAAEAEGYEELTFTDIVVRVCIGLGSQSHTALISSLSHTSEGTGIG